MARLESEFVDVLVYGRPIRTIAVVHGGIRPVVNPSGYAVLEPTADAMTYSSKCNADRLKYGRVVYSA